MAIEENLSYKDSEKEETGGHEAQEEHKIIVYPFDRYQIKIELTSNNEFVGITEVKLNKDFLSYKQKISTQGFHDVEEFYKE